MKWENSNTLPQKEVINLYGIVKDTLLILTPFIKNRKNININNIDKTKTIVGYPEPIKIILYNLIMNAIKYTESGFVLIYAYDTTEKTVVVIEDRGMGMTEQQIESILNRSFFVDSPNNVQNGNGFGYRIINGLLKKTGATMQIKSDKNGGGTSVSVFFDYEFH